MDDGDSSFEAVDGQWWLEAQGWNGDLHWAFASTGAPQALMVWRPDLTVCGVYTVQVFIPPLYGTSRAARYEVHHRQGVETVVFDQWSVQGTWATLGDFEFEPGQASYLRLTSSTGEDPSLGLIVAFDAARWVLTSRCAPPVESPSPYPRLF